VLRRPNRIDVQRIVVARDVCERIDARLVDRQPLGHMGSAREFIERVHAADVSLGCPGASRLDR